MKGSKDLYHSLVSNIF